MRIVRLARLAVFILLAGCATSTPDTYVEAGALETSESDIAIVRARTAAFHSLDGQRIKHPSPDKHYDEAKLTPAVHTLTLSRWFGVSVLLVPKGYIDAVSRPLTVELMPGRIYELHADRTTGPGFRIYFWIEDAETKELVAGERTGRK